MRVSSAVGKCFHSEIMISISAAGATHVRPSAQSKTAFILHNRLSVFSGSSAVALAIWFLTSNQSTHGIQRR